jgi:hypothetical protein
MSVTASQLENFLSKLKYEEIKMQELSLELSSDQMLCKYKDTALPLTDKALEKMCIYLKIPYKFCCTLQSEGKGHVLSYLQKQLSQIQPFTLLMVKNDAEVLSFSEKKDIYFQGAEAWECDKRIEQMVKAPDSIWELKTKDFLQGDGTIHYSLFLKEDYSISSDPDQTKPIWRWGFRFKHSVFGSEVPSMGAELFRMVCANLTYLPEKSFKWPLQYNENLDTRLDNVELFFKNPPEPKIKTLERFVAKIASSKASLKEVSEARNKLLKLKVDKADWDTQKRIEDSLEWGRIMRAYQLKDYDERPSKAWFAKATTPLKLFDVWNTVTSEASSASTDIDYNIRHGLLVYGGQILTKTPDLCGTQIPPQIDWGRN